MSGQHPSERPDPDNGAGQSDRRELARKVLAWGLTLGALLAALGAFIGYRLTGTLLGAAAGFMSIAIVAGLGQFVLVVMGAVHGMRSPD